MEGDGMVEEAWRVVEGAGSKELVEDGARRKERVVK